MIQGRRRRTARDRQVGWCAVVMAGVSSPDSFSANATAPPSKPFVEQPPSVASSGSSTVAPGSAARDAPPAVAQATSPGRTCREGEIAGEKCGVTLVPERSDLVPSGTGKPGNFCAPVSEDSRSVKCWVAWASSCRVDPSTAAQARSEPVAAGGPAAVMAAGRLGPSRSVRAV